MAWILLRTTPEPPRPFRRRACRRDSRRRLALTGARANSMRTKAWRSRHSSALTGNAVALTLLSLDLNDYFTARLSQASGAGELTRSIREREAVLDFHVYGRLCGDDAVAGSIATVCAVALGGLLLLLRQSAKLCLDSVSTRRGASARLQPDVVYEAPKRHTLVSRVRLLSRPVFHARLQTGGLRSPEDLTEGCVSGSALPGRERCSIVRRLPGCMRYARPHSEHEASPGLLPAP